MKKYVILSDDHRAAAFLDDTINEIPADAIEISNALYEAWPAQAPFVVYNISTKMLEPFIPPPPEKSELQAYANCKVPSLLSVMRSYSANGATLKSDAMAATIANLSIRAQVGAKNPADIYDWVADDNTSTELKGADFVALFPMIDAYLQSVYSALSCVLSDISTGAITSFAHIDAYAWPQ